MVTPYLKTIIASAALLLSACTVVDLDADGKPIIPKDPNARQSYADQTPQQVAEESWDSKVMATASQHALDWPTAKQKSATVAEGKSESVFVKAAGTVTAFNHTNERERSLTFSVNGEPVTVQLGPVIRSNAIRDAADFNFEDFTNQVQYAQLTRALNRHAVKLLPQVDESWVNKPVSVVMAVSLKTNQVDEVIAVTLKQETP